MGKLDGAQVIESQTEKKHDDDCTIPRQQTQKTAASKADVDTTGKQAMAEVAEAHGSIGTLVRSVLGHR